MNTIITEKIVFGGDCLAKFNGKNIFIPFAIPNEKLQISIVESKKDYDIAKIENIIEPSPYRIEPICKYYKQCGGCNLMHIDYNYQVELRKQILKDCFFRENIKLDELNIEIKTITGNPLNYRARFQLHDGALEAKKSNQKIYIDNCQIAEQEINNYLCSTSTEQRQRTIPGRCHLFGSKYANPNFAIANAIEKKQIQPKNKKIKHALKNRYQGISINQQNVVTVNLLNKKISFDVQGFFQSNIEVLSKTIKLIIKDISGKNVLDMYSGCGTFSVFLADLFEKVYLVEHNKAAIVFAEQNLVGTNHESYAISGAKWVKENAPSIINKIQNFDAVIIDPPRSGIEKEVLDFLCKTKPKVIKIISCDPATASRDIKKLCDAGYKIKEVYLLDFYPQTSHIESFTEIYIE